MLLYIKAFLHSCECVLQHICNSSVSNVLLLCNKSITIASHHQGVSVDFLRENAKNQNFPFRKRFTSATGSSKIPWICYVCVALHRFQDCFVTLSVLHFIFLHLFCNAFHAFLCMFIHLYAYFKVQQTFVYAFSGPLPSHPAALFWAAAGLWLYFLQQKTAQAAFSGPSVLCRIPYIKRRAAPKSRPPTIQAML